MSEQRNTETVAKVYAAWKRGDIKAILEHLTEDVEWSVPGSKAVPFAGAWRGHEEVKRFLSMIGETLEFEQYTPRRFLAQGDKVVALGNARVRIRSTGQNAGGEWAAAFTFRGGKIAGYRYYFDTGAMEDAFKVRAPSAPGSD